MPRKYGRRWVTLSRESGILVTACICVHNGASRLPSVLDCLRGQKGLGDAEWEVVVVDNGSRDNTGDVARATLREFPCRTQVVKEDTLGLSHARRRGASVAGGDVLVYVDDDNLLAPDYLTECMCFFREHPKAGVAGGRAVPLFHGCERPGYWESIRGLLATNEDAGDEDSLKSAAGQYRSVPFGAGMAFRRSVLLDVYGSETIVCSDRKGRNLAASGDLELGCRAVRKGWEAWYCAALSLQHVIPARRLGVGYILRLQRSVGSSHALFQYAVVDGETYPPSVLRALKHVWWFTSNRLREGVRRALLPRTMAERLLRARSIGKLAFLLQLVGMAFRSVLFGRGGGTHSAGSEHKR